jgi:L-ascorbate metabolism protein UlaG (beta-lactamase superfamily)
MADATLTWLGHASFRLDTPGGKRVYVDPWLDNPKCPDAEKEPDRCDAIAVTHGHGDHVASVVDLSEEVRPMPIVANVELKGWLKGQGAQTDDVTGPNKGGTVEATGSSTRSRTRSTRALRTTATISAKRRASSSSSRMARRSTSPATPASSATCS